MTIPLPTRSPAPFQSVRSSRDLSLAAFAAALLAGFALQAGAFLPRLAPAPAEPPRIEQVPAPRHEPAVVARHAPPAERRAVPATPPAAPAQPSPCPMPRG